MNIIKHGVETASFGKMLTSMTNILRFIGMDVNRVKWTYIGMTKLLLWFLPSVFFYMVHLHSLLVDPSLKIVCEFMFLVSAVIMNIIPKMITFLWFSDEVKVLLDMVVYNTTNSYTNTSEELLLLQKYTTTARITTNILLLSFFVAAFTVHVLPYLVNFIWQTWYIPLKFQLFGLSNTSHPGYDVHYLVLYGMVLYTVFWISSDVLFFYFTMYISFRYDLIQHMAAKLGNFKSDYDTTAKQAALLRQIVKLHSDILRFCRKFSETYSVIVFCQTSNFMLTVVICLTIFSINPLTSIIGLLVIGAQFLIFCTLGEMVNTKRIEASDAIYCSYWYNIHNVKELKMISFLLKNSQIDISFTAYGLFRLSLDTFVKVFKAAYTYFAFLKSII